MQKNYILVLLMSIFSIVAMAQSGEISGKITDENGEGIPFASVAIVEGGVPTGIGATTDFDGFYSIKPLNPGKYDVQFSTVGYQTVREVGVVVKNDQTTYLDKKMAATEQVIEEVVVIQYKVPLIDAGETSSKNTVTAEDIADLPTRNIANIASTTAGVQQTDKDGGINIRGGRGDAVVYYVDGIRVSGNVNLPVSAVEQIDIITGGVSAKFGNATAGVINISTKGGARKITGGVEYQGSLDRWRFDLVNFNLAGPLLKNKEDQTVIGYAVNLEYQRDKDPKPSSVDMYKVKDDIFESMREQPLRIEDGVIKVRAQDLTADSLEVNKIKRNTVRHQARGNAKLDFRLGDGKFLTVGGNIEYKREHRWVEDYALLNFENNPLYTTQNYKTYIRFTQNFNKEKQEGDKQSAFQNAFYQVQFDFEKYRRDYEDDTHGKNYWDYGYIGNFRTDRAPVFEESANSEYWELTNFADTAVYYTPSDVNGYGSNYNTAYYDLQGPGVKQDANGEYYFNGSVADLQATQAIINGERPSNNPFSINWFNTGRQYNGVGVDNDDEKYRGQINAGFDILKPGAESRNKHSLTFGVEYQQQVMRHYALNPLGLWDGARQLTNNHLELDTDNPYFYNNGELTPVDGQAIYFTDSIYYYYKPTVYNDKGERVQSYFDENFRAANGIADNEWINVYDQPLENFSIDYFSADELIRNNFVNRDYRGYDVYGNRVNGKVSFEDFWKKTDENGVHTRPVAPFKPIYAAGYIEDKFQLKDLTFRIGFRVDAYNANQKVLKDPYSMFGSLNAGEFKAGEHPSNIGNDYAVYTSDGTTSGAITGYRNGNTFYNKEGVEVKNYNSLGEDKGVPVKPDGQASDTQADDYDIDQAFQNYKTAFNFMPRLQFSFNITDNALFFAHYDVLSQTPQSSISDGFINNRSIGNPMDYYFIEQNTVINNPNLRPETTIDFQLGFKQKVTKTSALTFSAYYKEFKNLIQFKKFDGVNGKSSKFYYSYDNIDFGNTKGFEFGYDLRRTKNIRLTANYTLQFAEGTGSDDQTQQQVVRNSGTNFRTVNPLDFDSRHAINMTIDYRFGEGSDYNGPVSKKGKQILSNFGINLLAQARSGTPYTRQRDASPEALAAVTRLVTLGYINGSRIGWNFRADLKIDKSFNVEIGKKKEDAEKRNLYFNVYLWIDNLLGTANVLDVYRYTGTANDDGYLESPAGIQAAEASSNPTAYRDLYKARVNSPTKYSSPRRIYLGASVNF
ncbi:MAG: carboxypeptidase regulatory-like domain-containing protein [Chitinophagales bacterium]|nr:carboxypeptidase regulatory-like domain-containing protein [Chitinophagales bacterium]